MSLNLFLNIEALNIIPSYDEGDYYDNIDNANYISDYDGVKDYYLIYYGNIDGDSLVLEIINNVTYTL